MVLGPGLVLVLAGEMKGRRIPEIMLMTLFRDLSKKADQFDDRPYFCKIYLLLFVDGHFFHLITLFNLVDDFDAFNHFAEAGMVSVEVCRIVAAVANEKL